ncbi:MAG: hypothetical protein ACYDCQ_06540 [Dehalococcoidia bacterium]
MTETERAHVSEATSEALVICGDDGSVYAVPLAMLEQCRVAAPPTDEVEGYLDPRRIPLGRSPSTYQSYGLAPVIVPLGVTPGERLGIIFVGGRG